MGKILNEIAQQLQASNKKVQLIYAFNGTGKTRLSQELKQLIAPKPDSDEDEEHTAPEKQTVKLLLEYLKNEYGFWQQEEQNG